MLKNIIKVLVSNFAITIIGLINSFVFPVIMSVESYSAYHQFTLYVSYVNVCHLGIATGMFVYYGGQNYQDTNKARYKSEISLILTVLTFFTTLGIIFSVITQSSLIFRVALAIYPICMIASFKAMYQAWNRFTAYSVTNVVVTFSLTAIVIIKYLISGEVQSDFIIAVYLVVNYALLIYFMIEYFLFTKGVKRYPIFSKENFDTTRTGFLIMLGNYVMLLFHSVDRQFVNNLYSTYSFALYSFAGSTTNIMNVFITAMATPFYPRLAKGDIEEKQMNMLKEILFVFGAYSGCAYFVVAFLINNFITKYVDSLPIIYLFFAAFPATAVINVLYVNLYKATKQVKKYLFTLVGILTVSVVLNFVAVLFKGDYIGISIATTATYYIWLLYSQRDFTFIKIRLKDAGYLCCFGLAYLACIQIENVFVGFFAYGIVITLIDLLFYRASCFEMLSMLLESFLRKKGAREHE